MLTDRQNLSGVRPQAVILQSGQHEANTQMMQDEFMEWWENINPSHGTTHDRPGLGLIVAKRFRDKAVLCESDRHGHGLIIVGHNREDAWRRRLLYKAHGKVVGLIGSHAKQGRLLVAVDFSPSTPLVLKFVGRYYIGRSDFSLAFVYVSGDAPGPPLQRWNDLKAAAGIEEDLQLHLIPLRNGIAEDLLVYIHEGDYGTIIMGKRGLSGIKRRLLGSVSARLLDGLSNQSVYLID